MVIICELLFFSRNSCDLHHLNTYKCIALPSLLQLCLEIPSPKAPSQRCGARTAALLTRSILPSAPAWCWAVSVSNSAPPGLHSWRFVWISTHAQHFPHNFQNYNPATTKCSQSGLCLLQLPTLQALSGLLLAAVEVHALQSTQQPCASRSYPRGQCVYSDRQLIQWWETRISPHLWNNISALHFNASLHTRHC